MWLRTIRRVHISAVLIPSFPERGSSGRGPDPALGDALVLAAAGLYACSNVGEEYLVQVCFRESVIFARIKYI